MTDTAKELAERLVADDLFYNRGPNYEPLPIPASAIRKEAATLVLSQADEIERLKRMLAHLGELADDARKAAEAEVTKLREALTDIAQRANRANMGLLEEIASNALRARALAKGGKDA
jgi:hypothetical protein